jgi:hypothetical protein
MLRLLILLCFASSCTSSAFNEIRAVWKPVEVRNKILDKWGQWQKMQDLSPATLEFTESNKILIDGVPPVSCCEYLTYKCISNAIKLFDLTASSVLCDCLFCDTWDILEISEESMVLSQCFKQIKYKRLR